jgi:hypothetical protein
MEEYILGNQFTERYETGERHRVRSREGQNFVVEFCVGGEEKMWEGEKRVTREGVLKEGR